MGFPIFFSFLFLFSWTWRERNITVMQVVARITEGRAVGRRRWRCAVLICCWAVIRWWISAGSRMRRDARKRTNISSIRWWSDSAANLGRPAPFARISRASAKSSWSSAFATLTSCRPPSEVCSWPSTNASSSSRSTAGTARPWRGRTAILTAAISCRKVNEMQWILDRSHSFHFLVLIFAF